MDSGFEATARREDGVGVIEMRGRVDALADGPLSAAYREVAGDGVEAVLLNFAEVDYINSTGIAVVVGLLAQARTAGLEMRACGLSEHYREIFEITRLADFMRIFVDEATAVASKDEATGVVGATEPAGA